MIGTGTARTPSVRPLPQVAPPEAVDEFAAVLAVAEPRRDGSPRVGAAQHQARLLGQIVGLVPPLRGDRAAGRDLVGDVLHRAVVRGGHHHLVTGQLRLQLPHGPRVLLAAPGVLRAERVLGGTQFGQRAGPLGDEGGDDVPQHGRLARARRPVHGEDAAAGGAFPHSQFGEQAVHRELLAEHQRLTGVGRPPAQRRPAGGDSVQYEPGLVPHIPATPHVDAVRRGQIRLQGPPGPPPLDLARDVVEVVGDEAVQEVLRRRLGVAVLAHLHALDPRSVRRQIHGHPEAVREPRREGGDAVEGHGGRSDVLGKTRYGLRALRPLRAVFRAVGAAPGPAAASGVDRALRQRLRRLARRRLRRLSYDPADRLADRAACESGEAGDHTAGHRVGDQRSRHREEPAGAAAADPAAPHGQPPVAEIQHLLLARGRLVGEPVQPSLVGRPGRPGAPHRPGAGGQEDRVLEQQAVLVDREGHQRAVAPDPAVPVVLRRVGEDLAEHVPHPLDGVHPAVDGVLPDVLRPRQRQSRALLPRERSALLDREDLLGRLHRRHLLRAEQLHRPPEAHHIRPAPPSARIRRHPGRPLGSPRMDQRSQGRSPFSGTWAPPRTPALQFPTASEANVLTARANPPRSGPVPLEGPYSWASWWAA